MSMPFNDDCYDNGSGSLSSKKDVAVSDLLRAFVPRELAVSRCETILDSIEIDPSPRGAALLAS